jgi:cephalosporin hydroxylase
MSSHEAHRDEVRRNIDGLKKDETFRESSLAWMKQSLPHRYSYNFHWLGRPIIQYPQDMVAMQEIIWGVRPDLIVETGIAHGGSLIFYASICQLLDHGEVLGIDIDIRAHNREAIEAHPLARRIRMIEGSSISATVAQAVREAAEGKRVLVVLDSNHTHAHVAEELKLYAPLVSSGSYCVVFDTLIQLLDDGTFPDRPWGLDDNPHTAVAEFLNSHPEFEVDRDIEAKLQITVAPGGYLRRR